MRGFLTLLTLALSQAAIAAGPTGLGDLKLGMTTAEVSALPDTSPVRVDGSLQPYEYKREEPVPGVEKFSGQILLEGVAKPLKATLAFKAGALESMWVAIDSKSTFERFKSQISSKYGDPRVEDKTQEEQCIYRSGNSFKLKWGPLQNIWEEDISGRKAITKLQSFAMGGCPANLKYDAVGQTLYSLTIGYPDGDFGKKSTNPF